MVCKKQFTSVKNILGKTELVVYVCNKVFT